LTTNNGLSDLFKLLASFVPVQYIFIPIELDMGTTDTLPFRGYKFTGVLHGG